MMLRVFWVSLCLLLVRALPMKRDGDGSRILNGNVATEGQFPFAVSLHYQYFQGFLHKHTCTFSLITTKTCLGAAHCLFHEGGTAIEAERFCAVVSSVQNENLPCRKIAIVYPHADFDPVAVINDIALFIFQEAVILGPNVQTLKLAGPDVEILGESVTALGWGMKKPDGGASDELRYTSLNVVEQGMCEETLDEKLRDDQVCLYKEGTGTCGGDSGGPIVLTDTNVEIALVSYGIEICGSLPAVYTDVRKFIDWIKEHSEGEPEIKE